MATVGFLTGFIFLQFFTSSFKKSAFYTLVMIFLLVSGNFILTILPQRVKDRIQSYQVKESYDNRALLWRRSLPIAITNPFGVGLGGNNLYNAAEKNRVYIMREFSDFPANRNKTHFESSYLPILYALGFPGLLAFVWVVSNFFHAGIAIYRRAGTVPETALVPYLMSAMIVWLVGVALSPQIYHAQPMVLFVFLLALVTSFYQKYVVLAKQDSRENQGA